MHLPTAAQWHAEPASIAVALAAAAFGYVWLARRSALPSAAVLDTALAAVAGALAGSQMVPGSAGANSWGALLGGSAVGLLRLWLLRASVLAHLDAAAPRALLGLGLARIGWFFEGHHFGRPCIQAWRVRFPSGSPAHAAQRDLGWIPPGAAASLPVHPLQLYLALACLAVAGLSVWAWRRMPTAPGVAGACAVAGFLASTAALEQTRHTAAAALAAPLVATALAR